jgi:hypothetical protein
VTPAPLDGSKPAMLRAILELAVSVVFLPRVLVDPADERFEGAAEADLVGLFRGKVDLRVE